MKHEDISTLSRVFSSIQIKRCSNAYGITYVQLNCGKGSRKTDYTAFSALDIANEVAPGFNREL